MHLKKPEFVTCIWVFPIRLHFTDMYVTGRMLWTRFFWWQRTFFRRRRTNPNFLLQKQSIDRTIFIKQWKLHKKNGAKPATQNGGKTYAHWRNWILKSKVLIRSFLKIFLYIYSQFSLSKTIIKWNITFLNLKIVTRFTCIDYLLWYLMQTYLF